jgi:hypothetical protein
MTTVRISYSEHFKNPLGSLVLIPLSLKVIDMKISVTGRDVSCYDDRLVYYKNYYREDIIFRAFKNSFREFGIF